MRNRWQLSCALTALGVLLGMAGATEAALVAHWDFEEGAGTTTADQVAGNDGTLMNGATWVTTGLAPVPGGTSAAIAFEGGNDLVLTTFAGIGGAGDRTVSAWVLTSSGEDQGIVAWGDHTANGQKYHVRVNDAGPPHLPGGLRTEVQGGNRTTDSVVSDGQWHHIASVFSGSNNDDVLHYIDGVLQGVSGSSSQAVNTDISGVGSSVPVWLGNRSQGGANIRALNGLLDEVRIYDHALTPAEIAALASVGGTPPLPNPTVLWNAGDDPTPATAHGKKRPARGRRWICRLMQVWRSTRRPRPTQARSMRRTHSTAVAARRSTTFRLIQRPMLQTSPSRWKSCSNPRA